MVCDFCHSSCALAYCGRNLRASLSLTLAASVWPSRSSALAKRKRASPSRGCCDHGPEPVAASVYLPESSSGKHSCSARSGSSGAESCGAAEEGDGLLKQSFALLRVLSARAACVEMAPTFCCRCW